MIIPKAIDGNVSQCMVSARGSSCMSPVAMESHREPIATTSGNSPDSQMSHRAPVTMMGASAATTPPAATTFPGATTPPVSYRQDFDVEEEIKTLRMEAAAQRQDLRALRMELQVQRQMLSTQISRESSVNSAASCLCSSRLKDFEESVKTMVHSVSDANSKEIQKMCAGLESALEKAVSSAIAIERAAREREVAEAHAAMVAHGTYVVSRLEDLASAAGGCCDEHGTRSAVKALQHAAQAVEDLVPAGTSVLDSIKEEYDAQLGHDSSVLTYTQPCMSKPKHVDVALRQRRSLYNQDQIAGRLQAVVGSDCGSSK